MDSKRTILLVDDEQALRKFLSARLLHAGYDVVTAGDGEEALEKLKNLSPHLIILDINMPKMGGIPFYNRICADKASPPFPVLVFTARGDLGPLFKDLNVDGFISKPFDAEELLSEIKAIISKRYEQKAPKAAEDETRPKKIFIVEGDPDVFAKMILAFVKAGYLVGGASTAAEALERIHREAFHLVFIKLALPDYPGDVLGSKLRQMPKTSDTKMILYAPFNKELNYVVTRKLSEKIGIQELVESDDPQALLQEAAHIFNGSKP